MPDATPSYPQFTNLELGEGLFDQLMATVKKHIQEEFDKDRIRGSDYAKVYLGSMESVLANTTQYLLGTMLLELQREQIVLENEKLRFEIDHIYPAQLIKLEQEGDLIAAQILKINKEIEFLIARIATEVANVDGDGVTEDSIIGRQVALLLAQKLGFAADIEGKAAQLMANYDNTFQATQEVPSSDQLSDPTLIASGRATKIAEEITGGIQIPIP